MALISQSTSFQGSAKDLFHFLAKPSNVISMSDTSPSISIHAPNLLLGKGQLIQTQLNYGVFRLYWKSKITKYEPYKCIEHTLIEGPFKKWVHRQEFMENGDTTTVKDEIHYEVGFGPLGKIMDTLVIRYQFESHVKERTKRTTEKFTQIKREVG